MTPERGEGSSLDFKRNQYPFGGASEDEKRELLKDVLALANAWRRDDAYILIGVEEVRGSRSRPLGVSVHLDDARLQQFVNSKVQKPLQCAYEVQRIDGVEIGVIRVSTSASRVVAVCPSPLVAVVRRTDRVDPSVTSHHTLLECASSAMPQTLVLRRPRMDEEDEFIRAHRATTPEVPYFLHYYEEGMSLSRSLEVLEERERGANLPSNHVPSTFLFAFNSGRIVGRVAIRHMPNDFLSAWAVTSGTSSFQNSGDRDTRRRSFASLCSSPMTGSGSTMCW